MIDALWVHWFEPCREPGGVWWGGGLPSTNLVWTEPRCDAVASLRPWSAWLVGGGTWGDALHRQSRFFCVTLGTLRQSKWYLKIINGNPMGKIIYKWCIFFLAMFDDRTMSWMAPWPKRWCAGPSCQRRCSRRCWRRGVHSPWYPHWYVHVQK